MICEFLGWQKKKLSNKSTLFFNPCDLTVQNKTLSKNKEWLDYLICGYFMKLTIIPVLTAIPRPQYVFGTISPNPTLRNVIAINHIEFNRFACSSSWNLYNKFQYSIFITDGIEPEKRNFSNFPNTRFLLKYIYPDQQPIQTGHFGSTPHSGGHPDTGK
jgi:hypothetical protein